MQPTQTPDSTPEESPSIEPSPNDTPSTQLPTLTPETTPEASPDSSPETSPDSTPETSPSSTPDSGTDTPSTPETSPEATPDETPEATPDISPTPTPFPDLDGDGFTNEEDCDDENASVYPGAEETCNKIDDDCDDQVDEDVETTFYPDNDADGYGDSQGQTASACTKPPGYATVGGDCNDSNSSIYPQADESCNGRDDDCDGLTDEFLYTTYYPDSDGDGYGDTDQISIEACAPPEGYGVASDCDDGDAEIYPGASERCNELDDDCDSAVDEDPAATYFWDNDRDGYGEQGGEAIHTCEPSENLVENDEDCDDDDPAVNPSATEECDGKDNDCDGQIDSDALAYFYLDGDMDGYGASAGLFTGCTLPNGYAWESGDCNDLDNSVYPGAYDEYGDGVDSNCNGLTDWLTLFAGTGSAGYNGDDTAATTAQLYTPGGSAQDSDGFIYLADQNNNRIRSVSPEGVIDTVAGNGSAGLSGDGNLATSAMLNGPTDVAIGPDGTLYIADTYNHRIRKVENDVISSVAGGDKSGDGASPCVATDSKCKLDTPMGVAFDNLGRLLIADTENHKIRRLENGQLWVIAGRGSSGGSDIGDDEPAVSARLYSPTGVISDSTGILYIAESAGHRVRIVENELIDTLAGTGTSGYSGDGGPANAAQLSAPFRLALDDYGGLFIADSGNHVIRWIAMDTEQIKTVAGTGSSGNNGSQGLSKDIQLNNPQDVSFDLEGNLLISDTSNHRVLLLEW